MTVFEVDRDPEDYRLYCNRNLCMYYWIHDACIKTQREGTCQKRKEGAQK
jgi:hypothetical protein